ncbi:MAG: signal recognition particle protein [Thioalkalivibrionaceae bacterium]
MFDQLSERLQGAVKRLKGQARLTDENVADALRDVRMALLEADVALPVVREFIAQVRERARGQEVIGSLTPGQALIKVVHDELTRVMGGGTATLNLRAKPPVVMLVAGLQGAGKTTTVAKLARRLREQEKKRVAVVSVDVYRPAAIRQLETLAQQVDVAFFDTDPAQAPVALAEAAVARARREGIDVLLVDSAGRLAIDEAMMTEIKAVHAAISPVETLFVVDAMTGQDAANTAKAFHEALPLTGVVLTKTDGDARGGAALSVRHVTGAPIKFLGVGEKNDALEAFHPERIVSRMLGMGDVLSLVEEATRQVDEQKARKLATKIRKGRLFDMNDLHDQLSQMEKMGGLSNLIDKLPGNMASKLNAQQADAGQREMRRMVAIIRSMTPAERAKPELINGSRKRRIAAGSGVQIQDVNRLLKQHTMMAKTMKKVGKGGGMANMMRGLAGKFPGGGFGGPGGMPGGGLPFR